MSGINRNVFPTTTDSYNIFTNGVLAVGNNKNGAANPNFVADVCGNTNVQGTYYSYCTTTTQYAALKLPADSSTNRPILTGTAYKGMLRYNTDINYLEFYNGSVWQTLIPGTPSITITNSSGTPSSYTYQQGSSYTISTYGYYTVSSNANISLKLRLWGGGGAGGVGASAPANGSAGGYVEGIYTLLANTQYVFFIGQGGNHAPGYVYTTTGSTTGSVAFPDGGYSYNNGGYGQGDGGGSTRFGAYVANSSGSYNASSAVYYLIAGAGGGGTDYILPPNTGGSTVVTGWGGGTNGGAGGGYYNAEGVNSPGGGGTQSAGGAGGTGGRLAAGSAGGKYQGGNGTGGGGGGGYYGGGGASGYYSVGGGGSGLIGTGVTSGLFQIAVTNSANYYTSPTGTLTKPGNAGNGGTAYGNGFITSPSPPNYTIPTSANGSDGAITFTFQ